MISEFLLMKLRKISVLIIVIACASTTDQNMFESGDPIVAYIKGSSEDEYKFQSMRSFSEEYQRKVNEPGRTIRAVTNSNSSKALIKNNSSEAYHFDYLVKDPQGNLHFHIQQMYENGTVKGFYGQGGAEDRYLVVSYVADAKGYRATVRKAESDSSQWVGLKAERIAGKIFFSVWGIKSVAASAKELYTPGADSKKEEEDDSY